MDELARTPVVPLEAGAGPDNPPCPACGEPLFGWLAEQERLGAPVRRCESCGLGVVGAFILSFPAARNLSPSGFLLIASRRYLEVIRTVPDIVWALIYVFCFGVGPLAGVLAIATHATGSLGKLYSEVNENIDMRPLEGVKASGGTWFQQMRYGVVPQVIPNIISYTLLRFEINVRSSSIIGYVGAGGLGQEIRTAMSLQEYTDLSALFVIILVTVVVIDFLSEKLRHRIIGIESPSI